MTNKEIILKNIDYLTPREQKVLCMRFGLDAGVTHTLEEVGKEFGVTRERIRQIEAKAIERISNITNKKMTYCNDCEIKLNKENKDSSMRMECEGKRVGAYCKKCADIIRHKFFNHSDEAENNTAKSP